MRCQSVPIPGGSNVFELEPPKDDGLSIEEVGSWSAHKHHFLRRYIDAFTTSMKSKSWSGLHYIDLFAGAGIERLRGNGLDWGSPLIAAQAPHRFSRLHLCELDKGKFRALSTRIGGFEQPSEPQLLNDDANQAIDPIMKQIPERSLTLAFLDPYGLHLHFSTLRKLAQRRTDLVIFFPDHLDALRNWENVYHGKPDSNLDKVLGTGAWYDRMMAEAQDNWASTLTQVYVEQIRTLGYPHFEYQRIARAQRQPLYRLIFCSADEAGARLWRRVASKEPGGQYTLGFE